MLSLRALTSLLLVLLSGKRAFKLDGFRDAHDIARTVDVRSVGELVLEIEGVEELESFGSVSACGRIQESERQCKMQEMGMRTCYNAGGGRV